MNHVSHLLSPLNRGKGTDSFSKGGLILLKKSWLLKIILHQHLRNVYSTFGPTAQAPTPKTYRQVISHFVCITLLHHRVSCGRKYISFLRKAVLQYSLFLNLVTLFQKCLTENFSVFFCKKCIHNKREFFKLKTALSSEVQSLEALDQHPCLFPPL